MSSYFETPASRSELLTGPRELVHGERESFIGGAEADLIMAIDGYPTLADLTPDSLRHTNSHS